MSDWPRRDLLSHRAEATPDRTGLIDADEGRAWRFDDLDADVGALAGGLETLGVGPDSRVGVLLPTRPAHARVAHAIQRRGAVHVPLHARRPAAELAGPAERAGVDLLVCGAATAETAAGLADSVDRVVSVDPGRSGEIDPIPAVNDAWTPDPVERGAEALAVVLFTSGTTGQPKGVRLTRGNLRASAEASAYRLGVSPGDRWLCCLPMYHMGGLAPVFRTALYGTTLVVQRSFDAERTRELIADHEVTGVSLVPTMLTRLLDAGWEPPASLDTVLLGGAPASESLIDRCAARGVPVHPTYGTTETASQIATARPTEAFAHAGTVGQPLVNTRVRVVAPDTARPEESLDPGETGEILVAGPTVTPGYLDGDAAAAAFDGEWFHTGDLGYRDGDGRLWVLGRLDERIVTGGENVDPAVVAAAIREHPAVDDAAVVGLDDPEWGQRVAALVVGDLTPEAVREHCRGRLADFEVPKTARVADELPRTASGTVDRAAVRERLGET